MGLEVIVEELDDEALDKAPNQMDYLKAYCDSRQLALRNMQKWRDDLYNYSG